MTNTNLQHDSGDQHLAYGNQTVFINSAQVMTFDTDARSATDDGQAKPQGIAWGPVAAQTPITPVGADAAYPSETPTAWSNFLACVNMLSFSHRVDVHVRADVAPDASWLGHLESGSRDAVWRAPCRSSLLRAMLSSTSGLLTPKRRVR